jgi:putative phage-type endonuclease
MKIVNIEQNSPAWHTWRLSHLGSSDSPVIMGESPYKTAYTLWLEKLGLSSQQTSEAMQRGKDLEPFVLKKVNERLQGDFKPVVAEDSKIPYLGASFDGFFASPLGFQVVEIKCSSRDNHESVKRQICPKQWYGQLQKQVYVANIHRAYLCSYYNDSLEIIAIEKDEAYIQKLLEAEMRFWQHLKNLEPPCMSENDYSLREDEEWLQKVNRFSETQKMIKQIENEQEELKMWFIQQSPGTNMKGGGLSMTKTVRRGSIDYAKVPEIKNVNLEIYRKPPIEYWRFNI